MSQPNAHFYRAMEDLQDILRLTLEERDDARRRVADLEQDGEHHRACEQGYEAEVTAWRRRAESAEAALRDALNALPWIRRAEKAEAALREIYLQAEVARDLDEFLAFVMHHIECVIEYPTAVAAAPERETP